MEYFEVVDVIERETAKLEAVAAAIDTMEDDYGNRGGLVSIIFDSVEKIKETANKFHQEQKTRKMSVKSRN